MEQFKAHFVLRTLELKKNRLSTINESGGDVKGLITTIKTGMHELAQEHLKKLKEGGKLVETLSYKDSVKFSGFLIRLE